MSTHHLPLATQADLTVLKTELKSDVANLRTEFKTVTNNLAFKIVDIQDEIREIKSTMATKEDVNRIVSNVDAVLGKYADLERAKIVHGQVLTEHGEKIKSHEVRIKILEEYRALGGLS